MAYVTYFFLPISIFRIYHTDRWVLPWCRWANLETISRVVRKPPEKTEEKQNGRIVSYMIIVVHVSVFDRYLFSLCGQMNSNSLVSISESRMNLSFSAQQIFTTIHFYCQVIKVFKVFLWDKPAGWWYCMLTAPVQPSPCAIKRMLLT